MPRFRIRTLMILVAVTALFFWDATAHPVFSLAYRQTPTKLIGSPFAPTYTSFRYVRTPHSAARRAGTVSTGYAVGRAVSGELPSRKVGVCVRRRKWVPAFASRLAHPHLRVPMETITT
jgi:hypothetical protein